MKKKIPEAQLGDLLKAKNMTISTAESCTGGLISHRLTNIAGSSAYMLGGIVAYSNQAKKNQLGVKETSLILSGAVSEEVAREMAEGARRVFSTDLALSVTGIAGPGGGTPDKPVGLTFIGLATPDGCQVEQFVWDHDRVTNKQASADAALNMAIRYLNNKKDGD